MTKPKRKGGLVSEISPWMGRWGVYWRIQKWNLGPVVELLAAKYPQTWEARLILWQQRINQQEINEQCPNLPSSTGS